MIVLNDQKVKSLDIFSEDFFKFLEWIPGGYNWLKWAVEQAKGVICEALDEKDLLLKIFKGLHVNGYIHLNTFRMSVEKALSINLEELELLASGNPNEQEQMPELDSAKKKYNLVSNQELIESIDFLNKTSFKDHDLFSLPSVEDCIILHNFKSNYIKGKQVNSLALKFACSKASNIEEFVNFYSFFIHAVENFGKKNLPLKQKESFVQSLFHQYDNVCNYLIRTPNVGIGNTDEELREGLIEFIKSIQFIGYKTKAAAMDNLVKNTPSIINGALNKDAIENYMAGICPLIASVVEVPECIHSQVGERRVFRIIVNEFLIQLDIYPDGELILSSQTKIRN